MARGFAKAFYKSTAWRKCRASFIAYRQSIDGGLCQICKDDTGYIVHHREWITAQNINDPYITLNHSNLQYVCHDCHNRIDSEARYYFGEDGNVYEIE